MMTLQTALDAFLRDRETYCKATTVDNYRIWLAGFVDFLEVQKGCEAVFIELNEISLEDIKEYNRSLRSKLVFEDHPNNPRKAKNISKTTIRTYMVAIRAFYNFLSSSGIIDQNLMQGYRMIRRESRTKEVLTEDEVLQLDSRFNQNSSSGLRNYLIIHLMLDAGMRRNEVVNLQVSDIDFAKRFILIRAGKGDKDRMVLLGSKLASAIKKYLSIRKYESSALLCLKNGHPITEYAIRNFFNRLKKIPGCGKLHPHLLRHTFATSFIYYGGQPYNLMFFLGHSSFTTTQQYIHLSNNCRILKLDIYRIDDIFLE